MAMDFQKYHITQKNIDAFLDTTKKHTDKDIYITQYFTNEWLFLYIFKRYELKIATIEFRGGLLEKTKLYISKYSKTLQRYFPSIKTPNISGFIEKLLQKNEHVNLQSYWKEITAFVENTRGKQKFNTNHKFIYDIFQAFKITWFLEEKEYEKLKEDLQKWIIPEPNQYYLHVRKKGDILLDEDITLKFNTEKEQDRYKNCYILHKQIWENFFIEKQTITSIPARVIEHLYTINLSSKGMKSKDYKEIAKSLSYDKKTISTAIKETREVCETLNCLNIIMGTGSNNASKVLNPDLTCSTQKIEAYRSKFNH